MENPGGFLFVLNSRSVRFTKSLVTIIVAGSLLAGPQAYAIGGDGKPVIDAATCKAMVKAANAGEPVEDPSILHLSDKMPSYLADGTLDYVVAPDFPYRAQLDAAAQEWNEKLGGKVVLREVTKDKADSDTVSVRYVPKPNSHVLASASEISKEMTVFVTSTLYPDAIRSTLAHEFGHLLGIRHTCDYTLMAASSHRHPAAHVTPLDVVAVLQGQFD
ncbi:hypothetical protein HMPREF2751_05605 [Corynebacterium sp. HMSC063G05]|nr:hypothetical protein [Corynebacterium sp. LK22]MBC6769182.1 hypothetical protein [Corynebacterium sp. LK15]MBC6831027.1 hypothetical protein [Corynebacterium sp. LK29]OFL71229.1 hypothetical protein HMPREF2751_05605 [Corynebacterium sp. HMSC063G05]OHR29957.1 hypothetical protein HMPREF2849_09380 [Corynebacterium sp. HMSC073B01]PKZ23757.1 hypothetical protein CYJ43_01045 [Corynebacterium amycolatum]TXS75306.1 hypothetical protein CHU68_01710 [Corynebacterium sp. LK11]